MSEFTVEYDESVAFFGSDQECIGVLGTLRFDEDSGGVTGRLGGGAVDSTVDGISREKGYM